MLIALAMAFCNGYRSVPLVFGTKWLYPLYHMGYGIKASAHLYSLAVIMVLFSEKTQRKFTSFGLWFRLLVWLGQISFGIYLIHCFLSWY